MLEQKVEAQLKYHVESLGGLCYKMTSPGRAGVPDRVCIMPGGDIYFIEVKRPGKAPRALQRVVMDTMNKVSGESIAFFISSQAEICKEFAKRGW